MGKFKNGKPPGNSEVSGEIVKGGGDMEAVQYGL